MGVLGQGAICAKNVGTCHHQKAWARSVLVDVEKEWQEGIEGDWQQELPYKEELKLVRHSSDLR